MRCLFDGDLYIGTSKIPRKLPKLSFTRFHKRKFLTTDFLKRKISFKYAVRFLLILYIYIADYTNYIYEIFYYIQIKFIYIANYTNYMKYFIMK